VLILVLDFWSLNGSLRSAYHITLPDTEDYLRYHSGYAPNCFGRQQTEDEHEHEASMNIDNYFFSSPLSA
jgi:hypothetical protein